MFLLITGNNLKAQVSDTIYVGYTKTAYLLFSDSLIKYDVGSEDVIIRHNSNKLILQAQVEGFEETNLMVEANKKIFIFIVVYKDKPLKYLYDYTLKKAPNVVSNNSGVKSAEDKSLIAIEENTANKDSIKKNYDQICEQILSEKDKIYNRGVVKYKVNVYLRDMIIQDDKIYMKFEMVNNGNIPYSIDFYQFKVKNVKKKIKGESFQIVELKPLYEYQRPVKVEGKSTYRYVIVLDKFVLTENKKLVIEQWENNGQDMNIEGGRKIFFDITSKDIINISKL